MQRAEELGLASGWSHDVRTHLNILLGAVSMMDSGKLSQEQIKQYVAIIRHNVLAMLRLINHMLEEDAVCQEEEAKLVNLQIDGLLAALMESIRPYAADHQLELLCDIDAPLCVYCDAEMLERVLYNLLSNAVKCTEPKGFIYLSAHQSGSFVQINIADTGRGMSKAQLEQLCSETTQPVGMGRGLRLVKTLMAAMGGQVSCTSRENVGTTFYLKLPIAQNMELVMQPREDTLSLIKNEFLTALT